MIGYAADTTQLLWKEHRLNGEPRGLDPTKGILYCLHCDLEAQGTLLHGES